MGWTANDIPDQDGRVAVVTGANGGLGLETARELARKGAIVVMGVRNQEKAERAVVDIEAEIPDARLELRDLDLASLASVKAFAERVVGEHPKIDLLVNNAGVMAIPHALTADGFEMQFGTNHLGHFALTAQLMSALIHTPDARIVTVTSTARHAPSRLDPDDLSMEDGYSPWGAYGRSKIANMNFALGLNDRLEIAGARAVSLGAHPGFSNTDLQAHSAREHGGASQRFFARTVQWVGMPPSKGALPQLRAATDPEAGGGELYAPRWVNSGSPVRRPVTGLRNRPGDMQTLWSVSENAAHIEFDVEAIAADDGS
ncbi:MAG: oxidoreductase [Actinomycetia bacterium]|nr:oxidoreductase [Actinomycetes bacterium]